MTSAAQAPLLSEQDLAELIAECERGCGTLAHQLISLKQRLGPYASPWLGSGFEYQESRPYQPGDPVRQINWRYFARTGQLYTRLYEQERQARLLLVVDRRDVMRFGTRRRLKAAQAMRLALAMTRLATAEGMGVQLQVLEDGAPLSPLFQGPQAFERVEALLNTPCPPGEPTTDDWAQMRLAVEQLPAGSLIVLIGDLWDLEVELVRWLTALAPHKVVSAVWVQDQAELSLPLQRMVLHGMDGRGGRLFDPQTAEAYGVWAEQRLRRKLSELQGEGLPVYRLMSHDTLETFRHG